MFKLFKSAPKTETLAQAFDLAIEALKSNHEILIGGYQNALQRLYKKSKECDPTDKQKYHEWVTWWKQSYKDISKCSRALKQLRRFDNPLYTGLDTYQIYKCKSQAAFLVGQTRSYARLMIDARLNMKAARYKFNLEQYKQKV
jgi:hypothetical protein